MDMSKLQAILEWERETGVLDRLANSGNRLYSIWRGMMQRCYNDRHVSFGRYGGRGIGVSTQFRAPLEFRDWALAHGYEDHLTLDRKRNDRGYSAANCGWATRVQQARNMSSNLHITIDGVTRCAAAWGEVAGLSGCAIARRHKAGWTGSRLLAPLGPNKSRNSCELRVRYRPELDGCERYVNGGGQESLYKSTT